MERYKVTLNIESTERYEKAKNDLIQAIKSYEELTYQEKIFLIEQMLGLEKAVAVYNYLKRVV